MTSVMNRPFRTAVESLAAEHQQVLALHEVRRLSMEEIGGLLGLSVAQARIELRRARLAVCQRLSDRLRTAA